MNEDLLKEKIQDYFLQKKYHEREIPKSHIEIIQEVSDKLSIQVQPDSDHNYSHSTTFLLILDPKFGCVSGSYNYLSGPELEVLKTTENNEHWGVYLKLSLIDNVACYIINSRKMVGNELEINICNENDLPKQSRDLLKSIMNIFIVNEWIMVNYDDLQSEKRNWVDHLFSIESNYQPSIADMLFGSFDFYSAADI